MDRQTDLVFRRLWTIAAGQPGYVKEDWKAVEKAVLAYQGEPGEVQLVVSTDPQCIVCLATMTKHSTDRWVCMSGTCIAWGDPILLSNTFKEDKAFEGEG